ncbi:phage tail fiber protein [Klebsiella pneumoniae]|uniref:phage tail fiber protein n=1 Tax=Klebsiella pneumoniae TaxID=573 RepID=UPI002180AE4C|nr:phage tail fiber protein [Klebsiella pneumoniae]MDP1489194.1 phage tail fiber protein [Klebsiella pneumoniae]
MTVSTEVDHNDYTGNGVTTSFPYTFRIFKKSDLTVQVADLNENITVLTLDTDYSVTGAGTYSGGNVVLMSPLANGWQISISRDLPVTQETDLRNQGKFFAEVHEDAFDKLTMLIQQCFSFLRLSLRKPSFIANYYDALNNRIRNLRDPSQAQDAATKGYADNLYQGAISHSDENFKRALRVPESEISFVPSVLMRKKKILAFNEMGNPIAVLPESGSAADVLIELGSSSGAMNVYRNNAPIARIIRASIFEYMTEADQQTLMTSPGADVIADYALKQAIDDGVMVLDIPWNVGVLNFGLDPATLPLGFSLIGWGCRRPYTIADDSSFLNCGVVIRVAAGASFPFYSTGRHVFRDIVFDGRDKTTYLFYSPNTATQFNGTRLEGCGFYRFAIGIGWASGGAARYIGTMKAYFCSISGNGDGVRNLIDSMMFGCTINANDRGVALTGGANNNFFGGCRNEWNTGDNWYAYQSVENQIFGELCDRAGRGGVVAGAKSSWILNGVNVRRSGANQPVGNDYSANFIIIDDGKIELSGVRTGVGANDSGDGGTISPSYNVSALGSGGGTLLVSGSDMTGFVTSAINQKATTLNKSITGNLGMDDDVNIGMTQVVKGRRIIGPQSSGTLAGSVGATLSLTKTNIFQNSFDTYITRSILIECRIGSQSLGDDIKIPVRFRRENLYYLDILTSGIVASSARIGLSGTGVTVSLSINSSTGLVTVLLTSVDGLERMVNVSLLTSM